ncbi:hypothetical protein VN97_g9347 [Penicillium thymicola]|uniref:Protein kinase domain-containing protein n=1 Tax=Penicillium thymicola TaxID=293382 RepID=A0AAI9X4Y0_PENTH|nr:hypothetical protein VN97_g9347 [Penicillium thymicola]
MEIFRESEKFETVGGKLTFGWNNFVIRQDSVVYYGTSGREQVDDSLRENWISEGIKHIHSLGLVHNDINPSTIMLAEHGIPIMIELFIAKYSRSLAHKKKKKKRMSMLRNQKRERMAKKRGHLCPEGQMGMADPSNQMQMNKR